MADDPLCPPKRTGNAARHSNVVPLPSAAPCPVRQPGQRAAGSYRKGNPWPGNDRAPVPGRREAFELARFEAEIAAHRFQLSGAIARRDREFASPEQWERSSDEHWQLFDAYVEATAVLAETPPVSADQLRGKVSTIGRVWLRAVGERYDGYRAAIARDAERLGVKNPLEAKARTGRQAGA